MAKNTSTKINEILKTSEDMADKVMISKQQLIYLDKRRQETREAIRKVEKCVKEKKVWITVGSILIKMNREKALELLKKDQKSIGSEIEMLKSDQKVLVGELRALEYSAPYSGDNIKPMNYNEMNILKNVLHLPTVI